jgi:hypothetical protein
MKKQRKQEEDSKQGNRKFREIPQSQNNSESFAELEMELAAIHSQIGMFRVFYDSTCKNSVNGKKLNPKQF